MEDPPAPEVGQTAKGREDPAWLVPALLAAAVLLFYLVRTILAPFVLAAAVAYIFSPVVAWAEKRGRMPRFLAVLLLFLVILIPLSVLLWVTEPGLARETRALVSSLPEILRSILVQLFGSERIDLLGLTVDARSVTEAIQGYLRELMGTPGEAIHLVARIFETVFHAFLTLVLTFYFLLNPRPFAQGLLRLVPKERRPEWEKTGQEIHVVLGRYVRGLAFLVVLMATATWIGLNLGFHLPYALPIAVATGFLEIIPFVGPVTAGTIAVSVGLFHGGPPFALWIAVFYLVLRQLEDQLVMPVIIGHVVELHPVVAIFAVLAGTTLAGVLGALMAIPTAAALKVVFDHWRPE